MVSLLVAYSKNRVIGKDNDLPWHLPADLRRFKELTTGKTVVMGRKTFDSIIARNGKPLPNRTNVVITRDKSFSYEGVQVMHEVKGIAEIGLQNKEVFVIGGSQIFEQALPLTNRIYATEINAEIDGDTYFPKLDDSWAAVSHERHEADKGNSYDYTYVTYEKQDEQI